MLRTALALSLLIPSVALAQPGPAPSQPAPADMAAPPQDPPPPDPQPPQDPPPPPEPPIEHEMRPVDPAPMPPPVPVEVDDKAIAVKYDKGMVFETHDKKFELKLSFRNQLRFEATRAFEDHQQFKDHFQIVRARLAIEGHVFGDHTRFKFEAALGDGGGFGFMKDVFFDTHIPGTKATYIRAGQWRRPFDRQEMESDFAGQMNEHAITGAFIGGGRDLGIGITNLHDSSPEGIEYVVAAFNGFAGGADRPVLATTCPAGATGTVACTTPTPTNFPTDFSPAVVARLGWNHGGIKGYSEGDVEGGGLRYGVAGSYKVDLVNFTDGKEASWGDNMSHAFEVDGIVKNNGFSVIAVFDAIKKKTADLEVGALIQPGYFVVPKKVEVVGRFAFNGVDDRNQIEARAGLNWYFQAHQLKLVNDAGILVLTGEDPTTHVKDKPDLQLRTMLQIIL